jgi:type VI secretion system secreted protein Hcp
MGQTCARSPRCSSAVVAIAFALTLPTTAMADLITLKLPGITGDVTVAGQEGTIEVLSLTGNIQETVAGSPSGKPLRASGPPMFSDLMIHKRLDRSSPALFLALVKGSFLKTGVITFLNLSEGTFKKFFTITLTNVLLTKFQTDDSETEVLAGHEQINLNYDRIQLTDEATRESACWNIPTRTQC